MKAMVWACVLFVFMFVGGVVAERAVDMMLERVSGHLESAEKYVSSGDWEIAEEKLLAAGREWERALPLCSAMFHNQSLDNTAHALSLARSELYSRHTVDSLRAVCNALGLVEQLRNSDDLNLNNLL